MKVHKQDTFHNVQSSGVIADDNGAVALVLVVWVVVVLMAIVGQFSYSMRTEINITRNFKEEEMAYQLAIAGVEQAKLEILSAKNSDIIFLNEEEKMVFNDDEEEISRSETLGNGSFEYTIIDEDRKININTASLQELKYLFESSGVDITEVDTIVDSISDWRDPNDLHLLNGAEEDYYQSLEDPYSSKDGPLDSIEELLLVKGMTPEILYGSKGDDEEEESYEGVAQHLTVYNTGRLNINTAPEIALETVLGIQVADEIVMQRETAPITTPRRNGKVASSFFTIVSTGKNADASIIRTVKAVMQKNNKGLETVYWNDNII